MKMNPRVCDVACDCTHETEYLGGAEAFYIMSEWIQNVNVKKYIRMLSFVLQYNNYACNNRFVCVCVGRQYTYTKYIIV